MRDFHRPRYGNPLFPAAQVAKGGRGGKPSNRTTRRGSGDGSWLNRNTILGGLALVIFGAAWYAFWGPAFRITNVEFEGASANTEEILREALDEHMTSTTLLILPQNNVLLLSEDATKDAVAGTVYLDSIEIRKKLPDTLIVTVKEKQMLAVLEHDGKLFAVDEAGYVLRELTGGERIQMPDLPPQFNSVEVQGLGAQAVEVPASPAEAASANINGSTGTGTTPAPTTTAAAKTDAAPVEPVLPPKNAWPLILAPKQQTASGKPKVIGAGSNVFSADTVNIALQANARLPDVTGENVRWFVPDESADSIDATMATGWHVFLTTTSPFDVQSDRLSIILKEKVTDKRAQLEYVDLRYNERVFLRFKDGAQ